MKTAKGIEILKLPYMGDQIYPTLIWDDNTVVLVDAGFPGQLADICKVMAEVGVPLSKLNKIVITHQDIDHIGGLAEIVRASEQEIEVIAHEEEKPYIEGEKRLIKMTPERLTKMFESIPESRRREEEAKYLESLKSKIQRAVGDGELLPFCGGITVIHTPGHTPGHICLYHTSSKTLITGDALNVVDGKLVGPNPGFSADMDTAMKSVKKLTEYDIETAVCYHGGVYKDNVNVRIKELNRYGTVKGLSQ